VSISSWYSPAGRFARMENLSRIGQYQYLGKDPGVVMDSITLDGVLPRIKVPVLQIYGELDPSSPPEHAKQISAELAGPSATIIYPEGVHVLNNLWFKARPAVGDWLSKTLN